MVDTVTLELVNNRLDETVREMQHAIFRTGYSTIIRESKDTSAAITTRHGAVVGQQFRHPFHLAVFRPTVEALLHTFPPDVIERGDVFLMNDPYIGGSPHSLDVVVGNPVFADGELSAFTLNIAHKPDLGGLVPGTSSGEAREVYHEGLQIPPVRVRRGGETNEDVERLIQNNSRIPEVTLGDIRGQVGCTDIGNTKLGEILDDFGRDTVLSCFETLLDSTSEQLREQLADWSVGQVTERASLDIPRDAERWTDDLAPDEVLSFVLTVENTGDELVFDFTETDDQVDLPINLRPHLVRSACYYAVSGLVDPAIPANSGIADVCTVETREGSALEARRPAPCNQYMYPLRVVTRLALRGLGQLAPEGDGGLVADDSGSAGLSFGFEDPGGQGDDVSVQYELPAASYGGSIRGDGATGVSMHLANIDITPIEIIESEFPNRVSKYEVIPDSEGPGAHRGGFGIRREYTLQDEAKFAYRASSSNVYPPDGTSGGESPPWTTRCLVIDEEGTRRLPTIAQSQRLDAGTVVRIEFSGGAGYGDPRSRERERVVEDYRNGFVSAERAEDVYGVDVPPSDGPD